MSRYELAERIIEEFFPDKNIKAIPFEQTQKKTSRPKDSSLICNPMFNTTPVEEAINIMKEERKKIYK